ncbi:MAG: hypothetical protein WBQ44_23295 [Rhodococcus sp. (in: high G+C Gram-positive bacteria)]
MITIASVPTGHAYVRNLDSVDSTAVNPAAVECAAGDISTVVRLPDPVPMGAENTDRWWPPRWLEPEWLGRHMKDFDLLHLHFGFDSMPIDRLRDVLGILRDNRKPLVFTVHDLHNPHFPDNTAHEAHLDALIPAATGLITLTDGAAAEIATRWNAHATVVPHPHVAPLEWIGRERPSSSRFVIGVHAKSLRANLDPLAVIDTVVEQASHLPDAVVRIDIDDSVFGDHVPSRVADVGAALRAYSSRPGVEVRVHPRFDDAELWQYLTEIDVSVLPYRFGTHSGWLEACHDMGTAAIVPDCGYFSLQQPSHVFGFGLGRFDRISLAAAIRASHASRFDVPAASADARIAEREHISRIHRRIYTRAMNSVSHSPISELQ